MIVPCVLAWLCVLRITWDTTDFIISWKMYFCISPKSRSPHAAVTSQTMTRFQVHTASIYSRDSCSIIDLIDFRELEMRTVIMSAMIERIWFKISLHMWPKLIIVATCYHTSSQFYNQLSVVHCTTCKTIKPQNMPTSWWQIHQKTHLQHSVRLTDIFHPPKCHKPVQGELCKTKGTIKGDTIKCSWYAFNFLWYIECSKCQNRICMYVHIQHNM